MPQKKELRPKQRDSSLELFRIITMLLIVAHHYVVNSGVLALVTPQNATTAKSVFYLLFGWGGKTGINCFIFITGYFMCTSNITLKKFLKLYLSTAFYSITIYLVFLSQGYIVFDLKEFLLTVIPVSGLGENFFTTFLVFYLFIPFLNILINGLNEKLHLAFIGICLFFFSLAQTFLQVANATRYIGWFIVLYFISSYVRLYPKKFFRNNLIWGLGTITCVLLSLASVVLCAQKFAANGVGQFYSYVSDSNKLLAVLTAFCAFLFFKNLKMRYVPAINFIAASAYGVLQIHANSDAMRKWLWFDTLKNAQVFSNNSLIYCIKHAVISVVTVYIICTFIDKIRIYFLEKPFFKLYDKAAAKRS